MKPVVLITKTWCGNVQYERIAAGAISHSLEFEGALNPGDVEALRTKPDEFFAKVVAEQEQDEVPA